MGRGLAVGGPRARGDRREVLVRVGRDGAWRIVGRTQLPGRVESLVKRCGAG